MIPNTIVPRISATTPKIARRARFFTPVRLIRAASAMITMAITFVFPDVSPNPKSAATYPAARLQLRESEREVAPQSKRSTQLLAIAERRVLLGIDSNLVSLQASSLSLVPPRWRSQRRYNGGGVTTRAPIRRFSGSAPPHR